MPDFTDSIKIQNQSLTIQDIEALLINNINLSFSRIRPLEPCLFPIFDSIEEVIQEKHNGYILTTSTRLSSMVGNHKSNLSRCLGRENAAKLDRDIADFYILKVEEQKYNPTKYNMFLVLAIKIVDKDIKIEQPKLISSYQRDFFMLTMPRWECNKRQELKDIIDQNLSVNAISFDETIKTYCDNVTSCGFYHKIYKILKDLYCNVNFSYASRYRILLDVDLANFIETPIEAGDHSLHKVATIAKKLYSLLKIDFLIIDHLGNPVLGIAYHVDSFNFNKHNDNIKRTALERAGVAFMVFDADTYKQREVIYEVETCIKQYEKYKK